MYLIFIIFVILLVFNLKFIAKPLKKIDKKTWLTLSLILVFFFVLYWFFIPNLHRVYGDEPAILAGATYDSGNVIESSSIESLYRLTFQIFGFDNVNAIKLNVVVSILNLFLLFYLLYLLFENKYISLLAPVFLGVSHQYIAHSASSYTLIISLMYALLSSIFLWLFLKYDKFSLNLLLLTSLLLVSISRVEYILFIPISFVFWIVVKKKSINLKKKNIEYWFKNGIVWPLILLPFTYWVYLVPFRNKINVFEGLPHVNFSPSNFLDTLTENFIPLFKIEIIGSYLYVFFIALIISFYWLVKEKKLIYGIFLISVGLTFIIFYLNNSYYAPWFNILVFAYLSFVFVMPFEMLFKNKNILIKTSSHTVLFLIILLVLTTSIIKASHVDDFYYLTAASPEIVEKIIPANCLVVTPYGPNVRMGTFINAMSTDLVLKNVGLLSEYECKYFFDDYLCIVSLENGGMKEHCDFFEENFNLVPKYVIKSNEFPLTYTLSKIFKKTDKSKISKIPEIKEICIDCE